jgi:hypothetical protein
LVRAFWREARVARWVLLAVLLPLLVLFRRSILSWLNQPSHLPHLTQNVIEFITLYLAVSGILYAIIHEMRLSAHVRQLRAIEGSLSTRRLGRFPQYLDEIVNLLEGASRLTILADCADYGSFFAPEDHDRLHDAVCHFSKGTGHKVQILVAGPPAPFTTASSWSLNEYMERYRKIMTDYWPKYIRAVRDDGGFLRWLGDIADHSESGPRLKLFTEWLLGYGSEVPTELPNIIRKAKSVCDGNEKLKRDSASAAAFLVLLQARQYWFEDLLCAARVDIRHVRLPTSLFLTLPAQNVPLAE